MRKKVVFIADSLDNAYKFQQVLSGLDVEIAAGSTVQIKKLLAPSARVDLIVFEARGSARASLGEVIALADDRSCPMLVIVDEEEAERVKLPTMVSADFVVHGAGIAECSARVRRLLSDVESQGGTDVITVENMTINLATYQVTVGGNPIDFTYLEYALLSFLVRHPGHTFSRDALLQHVWGFDYYGGSRTVDVHVRRIRAKLGPELAQRLETVRGVGYLWSP
ncbi:MAG: winged helix-turn-helix domain-containing protein [Eggerthellaceae bacterium]|nr:winged helix-turn-helix domain-containing protein [Eggerthellaceae bacterium]